MKKTYVFVIIPINEQFNPIYETVIKPAVEQCNLRCVRADEIFWTQSIIDDMRENIQKARILVADLTDKNPTVFCEWDLAHAPWKNVILISQNIKDAPFDLQHYRCIIYYNSKAGAPLLKRE